VTIKFSAGSIDKFHAEESIVAEFPMFVNNNFQK
jgi:hypothetical protein